MASHITIDLIIYGLREMGDACTNERRNEVRIGIGVSKQQGSGRWRKYSHSSAFCIRIRIRILQLSIDSACVHAKFTQKCICEDGLAAGR